jgi:signal transduction histidine kinase
MEIIKKILIVDDKPENLYSLEKILETFKIEIFKAYSGNEALTLALEHEFALALIDVQMPDMDGYETVKLMRNIEQTRYLPVIFISAIYSDDQYLILGVEAGAIDFITKPINPQILQGKVKIFLELYEERKKLEFEIEQRKLTEASLRKTEKELLLAKEKVVEADKLKTAFLANMSHEIRTPLNAIVGFSNLMAEEDLSAGKRKMFIDCIHNSSEALAQLISDIIDIAKIEAGQLSMNVMQINIVTMLREIMMAVAVDLKKQEKQHIKLVLTIPEKIDSFVIETDGLRLRQVITNLLNNAVKFTIKGKIEFGFKFDENNQPEFFVIDTGIGIDADKINLIFDRFQQVYNEKVLNHSGTGLGLSIVKKIIELLGGHIHVTSEAGLGTSFNFNINPGVVTVKHIVSTAVIPEFSEDINLEGKKIIIAEDEYTNFILLKELLEPANAVIEWVKNGQEAIDAIKTNEIYDLILMDLKMPVKNGYEAYSEIRQINQTIPIVAQTAYAMSGEKEVILQYGFDGYLSKPLNRNELLFLLANLFKG